MFEAQSGTSGSAVGDFDLSGSAPDTRLVGAPPEGSAPEVVLRWAAERFGSRVALLTAFGREGCVLVDLIARQDIGVSAFTLDTGLFFPETYALWRQLETRYGREIRAIRPAQTVDEQAAAQGPELWRAQPDRCCELRKIAPLDGALADLDAWVTAVRRDQGRTRAFTRQIEIDARFSLVKLNPLAYWTEADLDAYVERHDVPTNPLHAQGYRSIGCQPCTTPVAAGEDPRAGRWRGFQKTECGLHTRPRTEAGPSPAAI